MFGERAREYGAHLALVNLVGGQDELVFDGQSLLLGPDGAVLARAAQFEEELLIAEAPTTRARPPSGSPSLSTTSTRSTRRSSSASATTSRRTAYGHVGLGDLEAGSTQRWSRCSRSTRSAPTGSPWSSCPPPTPARRPRTEARQDRPQPRDRADRYRDRADDGRLPRGARRPPPPATADPGDYPPTDPTPARPSPASPRRTCRRGCAAT